MIRRIARFKPVLAILLCSVASQAAAQAEIPPVETPQADAPSAAGQKQPPDTPRLEKQGLDQLYAELADPGTKNWQKVEAQIQADWSKSGSPSMDLLLMRGREALAAGDADTAIQQLSALTDHAPDFAEGWATRAQAFFAEGEMALALHDLSKALQLNPHQFVAMSGLGAILEQTGRPKEALAIYERVHSIHPHQPAVEEAIERLNRELGDTAL